MTSTPSPSPSPSTASPTPTPNPIPDADNPAVDLPLTMSASVLLTSLPRDAKSALSSAAAAADDSFDQRKVTIRFQPIGSAPILRPKVFKISASQRFETVVAFLRRRLDAAAAAAAATSTGAGTTAAVGAGSGAAGGGKASGGSGKSRVGERGNRGESVFCYVNSCFAPGGDEVVGNLWRCFKTDDQLIVAYAMTPAFG